MMLFIGLDSMEPTLVDQWIADGSLPNLEALMSSSFRSSVRGAPGFSNGALWPSMFTGVNPARHGRYFSRQQHAREYGQWRFSEDTDFGHQPFWIDVSAAGGRVGVIDMVRAPMTPGINGLQICDWTAHELRFPLRSWPGDSHLKMLGKYGSNSLPGPGKPDAYIAETQDYAGFLRMIIENIERKTRLCTDLLRSESWDLFMVTYGEPHDIGHLAWHLHDPQHPDFDADTHNQLGDQIKQVYIELDTAIGDLLSACKNADQVIVFGGNGMGPLYTCNNILDPVLRKIEASIEPPIHRHKNLLTRISRRLLRGHRSFVHSDRRVFRIAHNMNAGAIRFNQKGREPSGMLTPGTELDSWFEAVTGELRRIVNLETGQPVVKDIYRTSDTCHGPLINHFPDLLVEWNREAPIRRIGSDTIGEIAVPPIKGVRTGDHTPDMFLSIQGSGIKPDNTPRNTRVENIAPTLASMLGVELRSVDGTPILTLDGSSMR